MISSFRVASVVVLSFGAISVWSEPPPAALTQSITHAQATKALLADLESVESISARLNEIRQDRDQVFSFVINFDYDQSLIKSEFTPLLDAIGVALAAEPTHSFTLGIGGHTDSDGSAAYNIGLSERRAQAVERYFSKHFDVRFAETNKQFWGEAKPVRSNTTRDGMARNRRAEFSIRAAPPTTEKPIERYAVALSPDGRYAVSAAADNRLLLRNTTLDCHQRSLAGHTGKVLAATFSPNGRLALSGANDATFRVWDVATGREIRAYYGHHGAVNAVAITDDGRSAASGGEDRTVKLWNLVDDREIASLQGHRGAVTAVDFSPNGWYAASGDRKGNIVLWHVGNKAMLRRIEAANDGISSVVFFDNDLVLGSALDGSIKVWQASTGQLRRTLSSGGPTVLSSDVSADARFAVTGGARGTITIWNLATAKRHRDLAGHSSDVVFAAMSRDGDILLTADKSLSHRVWNVDRGSALREFMPIPRRSPTDGLLKTADADVSTVWTEPKSGIDLVRLPGGCFMMGCGTWTENCQNDELPTHEACIDELWIGRHEVTQAQWANVMQTNPSKFKRGGGFPVEQVSWHQAQEFLCRLNELTGMEFRLPSETEWEYACRSGGQEYAYAIADSTQPPIEEETEDTEQTAEPFAQDVYSRPTNPVGLTGMGDGLWEWVADIYEDNLNVSVYSEHQLNDPLYTGSNDYRFSEAIYPRGNRGGTWDIDRNPSRCALRHFDAPDLRSFFHGLRVVVAGQGANRAALGQ